LGTVILVDSNVLIDVFSRDNIWHAWSKNALAESNERDQLRINQIVVAEVAPQFPDLVSFMTWIGSFEVGVDDLSFDAAYAAGKSFLEYRQRRKDARGTHKSIIADFLIGGHAQTLGATILTRDPRFYRTYFPSVPLITPEETEK
jgi:predicted nucleic acid-binding protein